jgi:hypothetical protein
MSQNSNQAKRRCQKKLQKEAEYLLLDQAKKKFRTKKTYPKLISKRSPEEDKILSNLVDTLKTKNFPDILKKIPKGNKLKKGLIKGQWSLEEDNLLKEWIEKVGPKKWEQCGQYIHGRTGKQCREHWSNCLNPELIKGEWTYEEDFLIMEFYEKCNGSWKKMVHLFNGRTENSIKNRFFSQLRKIATKKMGLSERRSCAKIKLDELKQYLKEGLLIAKRDFLELNPMSEEELNSYINQQELKIKQKLREENDYYESNLSTNLGDLENNSLSTSLKSEKKEEKTFLQKRKRSENKSIFTTEKQNNNNIIQIIGDGLYNENNNSSINLDENKVNTINNIINYINIYNSTLNENSEKTNTNNESNESNHEILTFINNNNNIQEENQLEIAKNEDPFELKFNEFYIPFLENWDIYRTNSFDEFYAFNDIKNCLYNNSYINSFPLKRNININNNDGIITFSEE